MTHFFKNLHYFALFFQLFNVNTAASVPNLKVLNGMESIEGIVRTIVPIFKIYKYNEGIYLCNGVLIHPKAVLSSKACIQDFSAQSYAIGIFNWYQKEAAINPAKLYHVKYFLNSFMILGYLHTDEPNLKRKTDEYDFVTVYEPIILVMEKSINSISPTDISKSLTSADIYNENFEKTCYRIKIVRSNVGTYWKKNEFVFSYEMIREKNILSSLDLIRIYNNSIYEKYDFNNNTSIQYINNDSVFVYNSSKIVNSEISGLAGSPLICYAPERGDQFLLTGVLIDILTDLPMYFVVNGNWLEQNCDF